MKFSTIAWTLAAAGSLVAAQPHRHHQHHHAEKRDIGATTVIYVDQAGQTISPQDLKDGKYIEVNADAPSTTASPTPTPSSSSSVAPSSSSSSSSSSASSSSSVAAAQFFVASSSSAAPSSSQAPSSSASATSSSAAPSSSAASSTSSAAAAATSSSSSSSGVDQDFPDGELDCSHFPSDYGAVNVWWMGLGGWTGVQEPTYNADKSAVTNIDTAVSGSGCTEGSYCSYACPAGYQKSQWPTSQGSTGQSVGGLLCSNGKLRLTNSDLSKQICIPGTGNVKVQNKLNTNVAVCRTDYPGTEGETVPMNTLAGQEYELTCPNGNTYFKWNGAATSAQYYVNPKGVSEDKACTWGSSDEDYGNWAPINLGVGQKDGATWISIMQNSPTTNAKLDFDIEIQGDNLGGSCKYSNGQFYSATGSNDSGCTVQVMSGNAYYVFS
ncbi:glycoside hydrolase family 132 protein [Xylona heveae TC161]|uniref:Glycoside hydrolase family 132 protein n=1 Tax=Xylona heveae (strain CBS 132557 / TC161) TaxID=1328760 RepID=A0A165HHZ8_XYLHT|nr:glycoside hydrolase family 132 protein [Xylona heveae TC161]KZF23549.1 glycoside hydrolase family 132 protein [Xylona heveae TC161]